MSEFLRGKKRLLRICRPWGVPYTHSPTHAHSIHTHSLALTNVPPIYHRIKRICHPDERSWVDALLRTFQVSITRSHNDASMLSHVCRDGQILAITSASFWYTILRYTYFLVGVEIHKYQRYPTICLEPQLLLKVVGYPCVWGGGLAPLHSSPPLYPTTSGVRPGDSNSSALSTGRPRSLSTSLRPLRRTASPTLPLPSTSLGLRLRLRLRCLRHTPPA